MAPPTVDEPSYTSHQSRQFLTEYTHTHEHVYTKEREEKIKLLLALFVSSQLLNSPTLSLSLFSHALTRTHMHTKAHMDITHTRADTHTWLSQMKDSSRFTVTG